MNTRYQLITDIGVGAALLVAVAAVFGLDRKGSVELKQQPQLKVEEVAASEPPKPLRLAVTPPKYDNMGKLLDTLGQGYHYSSISMADLDDPKRLAEFDVVFLTCAETKDVDRRTVESLREFVAKGGTLYASDLRFRLIAEAFPEVVDRATVNEGRAGEVTADVVDKSLADQLGRSVPLHFDLAQWRPAAFAGPDVKIYLRGEYRPMRGSPTEAPLLVKFAHREGSVIFTSFHNEKQSTETELKLLKHLVFAAVTAKIEAKIAKRMVSGGFSPQQQSLLSASAGSPSVTQKYHLSKPAALQFALGFANQGAKLRLTVVSPDGRRHEKEGKDTFTVEIPDGPAGEYTYTVTAVEVPYPNFPFTLTIGEPKGTQ